MTSNDGGNDSEVQQELHRQKNSVEMMNKIKKSKG